jgi:dTDP-L-rhamnose 4-epimerase
VRLLVTGGAGFIGHEVVRQASARGDDVAVLDSLRDDVHRHRPPPSWPAGVRFVRADVRDAPAVAAATAGVDAVVHLAGKVGLGVQLRDTPDYVASNDLGTAVLLTAAASASVRRLVLASSMVVYGEGRYSCRNHGVVAPPPRSATDLDRGRFEPSCPTCGEDLTSELVPEDARLDPRNAYAASKVAQEHLGAVWARETGGAALALRFHNVYGRGLPRDTPYAGVAALFLSSSLAGRSPTVFEDGGQRRDFVHVRDVAAAVLAAVSATADAPRGTVRAYNVGSGRVTTVGEMARLLAAATGGPAPVVTGRYRLGDVRHVTASHDRLVRELGWRPQVTLEDGLRELAASAAEGRPPD